MRNKIIFLFTVLLGMAFGPLRAQDERVSIHADLERGAEQWLIKIGMINKKKPPKVKFGPYSTEEREGKQADDKVLRFNGVEDVKQSMEFSFTLVNKENDSVYVEAYSEENSDDGGKDFSIYMATSMDTEELWILMLSTYSESKDISTGTMVMTNGTEEISFKNLAGLPSGKSEQSAPKGLEIYLENLVLGAMQYDSGATFGYRKYIWINPKASQRRQLLAASVFPVLLEVGGYFEKALITD